MEELIGEGLGSLVGLYNADKEREYKREQDEKRRRYMEYANTQAQNQYNNMMDLLDEYDANRMKYATPEMQQEFMDLVNSYNPSDYVYDFDKFSYDKSVDDFIDPNAQKISEMAGLQTQADATAGGAAGGTGALANMGYSRWQAASDLYKQAKQDLMNDRQQAYREYSDYIGNMQNKLNAMSTQQMGKINLLGGNIDKEQQLNSDYMSDLLGIMGDKAQTQINTTMGAF